MIFKTLFRPKYQDPNPHVRLKAIDSLSPHEPAHKSQLHELAFNDEHAGVSLAALSKLDSFALWSKMAQIARDEKVRKRAQNQVEQALFGDNSELSEIEKRTYFLECNNNNLLEKALREGVAQGDDTEFSLALLKKLDKPHLSRQILLNEASDALQISMLQDIDDVATLAKLVKKGRSEQVVKLAQRKLDELAEEKAKPQQVSEQARMLLSRLLALKENADYETVIQRRGQFEQSFEQLSNDFTCLTDVKRNEFQNKFADINKKLDTWLMQLKPQWQSQKQDEHQQNLFEQLYTDANRFLSDFSATLGDVTCVSEQQIASFKLSIQKLKQLLDKGMCEFDAATSHRVKLEMVYNKLIASEASLGQLPAFQSAISVANDFLTKFSELPVPNDVSQLDAAQDYLKEQSGVWYEIKHKFKAQWPDALEQDWKAHKQHWQTAIKAIRDGLYQDLSRCRSKLRALDNMVQQGKFRSAMGLYEKVQLSFNDLPEKQQNQIQRLFDKAKSQIENLRDWQEYIARPRKPAVLAEAEALASSPLSIDEQAEQVKLLRQQWNSLGKLDTESDQALNIAFDEAIENAFTPCRKHYAALQQTRSDNLKAKQAVITELTNIDLNVVDIKTLAKVVREKQQLWQNTGEIDYRELDSINRQYQDAQKPLKAKLNQYYADNAEKKAKLVKQAESLLQFDDVYQATEQAKQLQQSWRKIDHAGRKQEGTLWKAFRKTNDQIFARRQALIDEANRETDDLLAQIQTLLEKMREAIDHADDKTQLSKALRHQSELQGLIENLPQKAKEKPVQVLRSLVDKHSEKLAAAEKKQLRAQYAGVFHALRTWTEAQTPDTSMLPSSWQNCFYKTEQTEDRHDLTLMMEIISSQASPAEEEEKRKQVQLQMLANKLQQGGYMQLDDLLKRWIGQGSLTSSDVKLLDRVEALY